MVEKLPTYQKLQADLDELMVKLQSDDLDVDEAIDLYQKAAKIIAQLQKYLKTAENKLSKIKS